MHMKAYEKIMPVKFNRNIRGEPISTRPFRLNLTDFSVAFYLF